MESPHERAWTETLEQLFATEWQGLRDQTGYRPSRFTPEVYRDHVSGKPRLIFFDDVPRNPTGKIEKPKLRKKYADLIGEK